MKIVIEEPFIYNEEDYYMNQSEDEWERIQYIDE